MTKKRHTPAFGHPSQEGCSESLFVAQRLLINPPQGVGHPSASIPPLERGLGGVFDPLPGVGFLRSSAEADSLRNPTHDDLTRMQSTPR